MSQVKRFIAKGKKFSGRTLQRALEAVQPRVVGDARGGIAATRRGSDVTLRSTRRLVIPRSTSGVHVAKIISVQTDINGFNAQYQAQSLDDPSVATIGHVTPLLRQYTDDTGMVVIDTIPAQVFPHPSSICLLLEWSDPGPPPTSKIDLVVPGEQIRVSPCQP